MAAPYFAPTPPPPGGTRPPETLGSTAGWATAAKVTVGLTMAATVGTGVTSFLLARSWIGFDEGTTTFSELLASEERHNQVAIGYLLVQIAAWVCVITWLFKAAKNAERINPGRMNNTPKWAIWGWFVPFMNLVRPYHMVKETWEASDRGDTTPTPVQLIGTWWGLLIASEVAYRLTLPATSPDSIAFVLQIEAVADLVYVVAGVLFLKIISMVELRQANASVHPSHFAPPAMPAYVLPEADQIIT